MKSGQNQKVQLIILCCLIAVVAAVGVYRVIGTGGKAGPREARQSQVRKDASASSEEVQADTGPSIPVCGELKARDPFVPQVGPKGAGSGTPCEESSPLPSFAGSGTMPAILPMPSLTTEPIRVNNLSPSGGEQAPELRLTGVIEGDMDVAIIRGGENTRYIVREGQIIDGKYTVESISRAGVRLRYNNKSLVLRLGSSTTT